MVAFADDTTIHEMFLSPVCIPGSHGDIGYQIGMNNAKGVRLINTSS